MYRCLLRPGETNVSLSMFVRPLDCAIFLLAGGHFAAGVFKDDKMVVHRTFHRYVIRAKQGGVQSANDNAKGPARSAGAAMRRYNERALCHDIMNLLKTWADLLASTPLVFIRCASYQKVIFHEVDEGGFDRKDPRLRTIPFETKRPLIEEVRRVWERLSSVTCHGPINEFVEEKHRRKQRIKVLPKKKRVDKETDHLKPFTPIEEKTKEVDNWPSLDKNLRRELYAMIKDNNDEALATFVNTRSEDQQREIYDYLSSFRLSDNGTFLHLAAKNNCDRIVQYLLEFGCDPSIKDDDDLVPYALSPNKAMKHVFIQYRSENPNKWNWMRCHIPEPIQ
ncbi:ankyrin repeat protein, partial [Oesophagostomum dentatum]